MSMPKNKRPKYRVIRMISMDRRYEIRNQRDERVYLGTIAEVAAWIILAEGGYIDG